MFYRHKEEELNYPYYQVQESIRVSETLITKMVDRLFAERRVIGGNEQE
jgi:hypothetical protein